MMNTKEMGNEERSRLHSCREVIDMDIIENETNNNVEYDGEIQTEVPLKASEKHGNDNTGGGSGRSPTSPCGVCGKGVGAGGIWCEGCSMWLHNGRIQKCSGLGNTDVYNSTTYRCPTCIGNRNNKNTQKGEIKPNKKRTNEDANSMKSNEKKQKLYSHDHEVDFIDKFMKELDEIIPQKTCIDCNEEYDAIYKGMIGTKCERCGVNSHGCKGMEEKREEELYKISKGYIWLCLDCKKKIKNQGHNNNEAEAGHPTEPKENDTDKDEDESEEDEDEEKTQQPDYIKNISDEDLKSLEEGEWVTDIIISQTMSAIEQGVQKYKTTIVDPSVVQLLRKTESPDNRKNIIKDLKMDEKEYVIFPVNNNDKMEEGGGSHWSLLVYSKKEEGFYHHDPIKRANYKHAVELMYKISVSNDNFIPKMTDIPSPKQCNGYDCGPYIIMYANKMAENITHGDSLNFYNVTHAEAKECRKTLRMAIIEEKKKFVENERKRTEREKNRMEKEKNVPHWTTQGERQERKNEARPNKDERKNTHERKSNEEKHIKKNISEEPRRKEDKVCRFWIKGTCNYDMNCYYAHPIICKEILDKGTCQRSDCKHFHPKMCRAQKQEGYCMRGRKCYFSHHKETHHKDMNNRNSNWGNPNTHQTRNQHDNFDQYNQRWRRDQDFQMSPNHNWKEMMTPIIERAAEMMTEMMWRNY